MTAKEQGLSELPQTPFCLRQHDETGRTTITDGPIDPILWQRWNKVSSLYTADQMRAYARAALASDTGERGVVEWLNHCDTVAPAALRFLAENDSPGGGSQRFNSEHLYQLAHEIEVSAKRFAALRAQPAGGGDADGDEYSEFRCKGCGKRYCESDCDFTENGNGR